MKLKKLFNYALVLLMMIGCVTPMKVKAACSLSVYADTDSCEVGDTVTFTISVEGAGDVSISGAVDDYIFLDNETASYTVEATEAGSITVYVSGNIADYDTEEEQELSDSCTVTVNEPYTPTPDPEPEPEPEEPEEPEEDEKSKDATLAFIEVDRGRLTPSFSSDIYEYTVELTSKETEINIEADSTDYWGAKVEGTGLKPLKVGENSFTIDVTAEDGKTRKAYTINVKVKEVPTLFFDLNGKKLGILNDVNTGDIPKGFVERKIFCQEKEVKAFSNEKATMTLLYMTDEQDNKGFYIYSQENQEILGLYRPMIIDKQEVMPLSINPEVIKIEDMKLSTLNIQGETLDAYVFDDKKLNHLSVLYMLNGEGKETYYIYDSKTQKLVAYPEDEPLTAKAIEKFADTDKTPWMLYVGIGVAVLVVVGGIIFFVVKKKKKKNKPHKMEKVYDAPEKPKERKLVTDETFFKDVPEETDGAIYDDDGIPLSIESALKDIDSEEIEETINVVKEPKIEISETDDEDDDWLDENMMNSIFGDDE